MKTYRVQMMSVDDYARYMGGSNEFVDIKTLWIEAENAEIAADKAERKGYVVNRSGVKSLDQIETEERAFKEYMLKADEKKAEAKEKRKASEAKKASEMGVTVEEYRKIKAKKAKITRVKKEIEKLEAELKQKKAYLKRLES